MTYTKNVNYFKTVNFSNKIIQHFNFFLLLCYNYMILLDLEIFQKKNIFQFELKTIKGI